MPSVQELSDKTICFVNDGSVIDDTVTIPCMICKLLAAVRFFLVKKTMFSFHRHNGRNSYPRRFINNVKL